MGFRAKFIGTLFEIAPVCGFLRPFCGFFAPVLRIRFCQKTPKMHVQANLSSEKSCCAWILLRPRFLQFFIVLPNYIRFCPNCLQQVRSKFFLCNHASCLEPQSLTIYMKRKNVVNSASSQVSSSTMLVKSSLSVRWRLNRCFFLPCWNITKVAVRYAWQNIYPKISTHAW